jgi:hypothetical protein
MKYLPFLLTLIVIGCSSEKREETIDREIRLKEVRKGHEVIKLIIDHQKTVEDTSEIHYTADIKIKLKEPMVFYCRFPQRIPNPKIALY